MADGVGSSSKTHELPEVSPRRFYSRKSPEPGLNFMKSQSMPGGIVQALNLDRSCSTSRPHQFKQSYLSQHLNDCNRMYSTDLIGHHGCVNALAFSKGGEQFLATGKFC